MKNSLAKIAAITSDPYGYADRLKDEKDRKIIGCFPMHIPEELIHAADLIPMVIWRGDEPVTWGHAHVPPYNWGIVRSFVDDALKGKLSFMDGMVFHIRQCLPVQELPFIIERHVKPAYQKNLYLPPAYPNEPIRDFAISDLDVFRKSLEDFSGNKITDEKLKNSIGIYNKNRSLLEKIYEIRRERPEILKASQLMRIVLAGMLMPKEDHNDLLEPLIRGMEEKTTEADGEKIRVIVVGCLCQTPQLEVLDMIEDLGMIIADDDLFVGSRYFANKVALDGNPLDALADRYLHKTPVCPTMGVWDVHWGDEAIRKMKACRAKGIISVLAKFCPPHACYYPDFKSRIVEEGVQEVMIEVEHEMISLEGTKTRLQSFAESLGGA